MRSSRSRSSQASDPRPFGSGILWQQLKSWVELPSCSVLKTRWVAWGLIVYLIIATLVGHPFWAMEGPVRFSYQFHFYKNLAIIAAYLMLIVSGPGAYSVDAKIGEKV